MKSIASQPGKSYILGDYLLETDSQLLSREGQRVHLPRRPFQVLLYLIEHRDQVISRSDLLDHFREGKDVYDDSLRKCLGTVRKASQLHYRAHRFPNFRNLAFRSRLPRPHAPRWAFLSQVATDV